MQEHKYPTAFPLKHQQKDMRLALELAHQHGQHLPTAAAANGLYEQVRREHRSLSLLLNDSHVTCKLLTAGLANADCNDKSN